MLLSVSKWRRILRGKTETKTAPKTIFSVNSNGLKIFTFLSTREQKNVHTVYVKQDCGGGGVSFTSSCTFVLSIDKSGFSMVFKNVPSLVVASWNDLTIFANIRSHPYQGVAYLRHTPSMTFYFLVKLNSNWARNQSSVTLAYTVNMQMSIFCCTE